MRAFNGNCELLCDVHPFCTSVDVVDARRRLLPTWLVMALGAAARMPRSTWANEDGTRVLQIVHSDITGGLAGSPMQGQLQLPSVHRWQWHQQLDPAWASSYSWSKQGTLQSAS